MLTILAKFALPTVLVGFIAAETSLGEINWSSTITLGSLIIGVLLGISGLAVFGYGVKWKTAYETEKAVTESLRDGRDAYQLRGDRLAEELKDCRERETTLTDLVADLKAALGRLEERPDLNRVLEIIGEQSVRQDAQADLRAGAAVERLGELFSAKLDAHDARAAERQEHIIKLLKERTA